MSIILDALNKADDEKNSQNVSSDNPTETETSIDDADIENVAEEVNQKEENKQDQIPNTPDQNIPLTPIVAKKSSKLLPILLIIFLIFSLIGGGIYYFGKKYITSFFTNEISSTLEKTAQEIHNTPIPVKDDPKDKIPGLKVLANKLYDQKKYEQSIKVWKQIISIDENESEAFNNLGIILKKLNQNENAKKAYLKALQINSDSPSALNNLGTVLLEEQGQELKAYSLFKKALKINEAYAPAHFHLAILMERKGELELAVQHFEKFLKYSDKIPDNITSKIQMRMTLLKAQL